MAGLVRYASSDIVVSTDKLVTSTWSNNTNNLQNHFTASTVTYNTVTSSAQFFLDVFNNESISSSAEVQYAVAYGHKAGSGSPDFTNDSGSFGFGASRVIYNQYRQLVFGDESRNFRFGNHTPDDIYVINVNRARFKHNLKPGSLNLVLNSAKSGEDTSTLTPEQKAALKIHLTDDSVTSTGSAVVTNLGRQFNIVSGSSGIAVGGTHLQVNTSASYGLFYPDSGVMILNPDVFGRGGSSDGNRHFLAPDRNSGVSTNVDLNHRKLFNAISGAGSFIVDSEEKITSQYYFTRAKNNEFNYTTNPSFVDNNANVLIPSFIDNPQTFITTVGLYNDNNDLVAVAKLSQPVTKDFTKEALIRVKLDY